MEANLQRRIQRYGWDRASDLYEQGWHVQLAPGRDRMLAMANLRAGESVLDVASGTGAVTFAAARAVGPMGYVLGTDISESMVMLARKAAQEHSLHQVHFHRADAEDLKVPPHTMDASLCAFGLMYVPDPLAALTQMTQALKPGGRAAVAVWGERRKCGWADIFSIVDARVKSEVCPMFFHLGTGDALQHLFARAGFKRIRTERMATTLHYENEDTALMAAFAAGPVAMAYSRFDAPTRAAAHAEYLQSIAPYGCGKGYDIPGEFVLACGYV
jgi:ubiquinone/menaquinone biosynthesis C-methylase UbiE